MKKHVIIATGAALLSTSAFATKARMTALGQDEARGSQYLNDTRNVFRNAAHVNNVNNYVVTEWGTAAQSVTVDDTTDETSVEISGAHYEGGMFRNAGAFSYGIYFNNLTGTRNYGDETDLGGGNIGYEGFQNQTNALDLFFAGDAGVQWGVRLNYASDEDKNSETETKAFGLGLGMIMGDISAYANLQLKDDRVGLFEIDQTGTITSDKDVSLEADGIMNIGAAYKWNNWTFHVDFNKLGYEVVIKDQDNNTDSETTLTIGAAQVHEISSTAMVFTALDFLSVTDKYKAGSAAEEKDKDTALVATIGFEADATSWLTWRGSISQRVLVNSTKAEGAKKASERDTTTVGAGASLTFGKLMVDGTLEGASTGDFNFDELMGSVAVSYWF